MEPHLASTVEATIAASPNRQRIRALADKLTGLSDELGHEKQARAEAVELKLKVWHTTAPPHRPRLAVPGITELTTHPLRGRRP